MKVLVFGGSGMLGSMVVGFLEKCGQFDLTATVRQRELAETLQASMKRVEWTLFDAETSTVQEIENVIGAASWAVNAIGVIKPYIHDDNAPEVERATRVNVLFPHMLAKAAAKKGCRVLQIATDCVFSGNKGRYLETDRHDALDVYGKTKSLGEVFSPQVFHLRCSIVGPEPKGHVSLLDWFLGNEKGAELNGFVNHGWNGVTTLHFAKICSGIISQGITLPHIHHLVPAGSVTKYELLQLFATSFGRSDLTINPTEAPIATDRTLATRNDSLNRELWQSCGNTEPPTVADMVKELAAHDYRFSSIQ